jgi:membrane protein implicated in regulation of membrane protease activity
MLTLYIVCAVVGGGLMLLSALGGVLHGDLGGGHEVEVDTGHEIDFQHDIAATDVDHPSIDIAGSHDVGWEAGDFWLAFVSMRFLTYFVGIFGIFGLVLTWFSELGPTSVALFSALVAFVLGYGGSLLFRYLKVEGETSGVTEHDYVGVLGRTLVGIRPSQPGKVRVSIKGDTLDLIALSEGEKEIAAGEEIVVVGLEGDRVRVAPKGDYLD